jgi:hypothetical protein
MRTSLKLFVEESKPKKGGNNMKNRILCLFMIMALCLILLPATAMAADSTIIVGGQLLSGSTDTPAYAKTDTAGTVSTEGADETNYNIKWDGSTLTLYNAAISGAYSYKTSSSYYAAIYRDGDLNLALNGANTVNGYDDNGYSEGIVATGSIDISGAGSLDLESASETTGYYTGIYAASAINISGGTLTATASGGSSKGIYTYSDIMISPKSGQQITVKAGADKESATELAGSPFAAETNITTLVEGCQYFYSYVNSSSSSSETTSYYISVPTDSQKGTISVSPSKAQAGTTVSVKISPDEGYGLKELIITDQNGKQITPTKVSDTEYTFTMPKGNVKIKAEFAKISPLPFVDVETDDWFYDAVKYVYDNAIMTGTKDDLFSPEKTLTRAEAATVLWRLEGEPQVNYALDFTDTATGQWYTEAVRWAAAEKIMEGYGDNLFGTNDVITREQLATILYRYAEYKGYDLTAQGDLSTFTDANQVSGWAQEALEWASGAKLMEGNQGILTPGGDTTRCEFATMAMRFMENIVK